MIVGTGIDIAEVPRIRHSIARFGDRFLGRIFTAGERRYCDSKANRVERYAVKPHGASFKADRLAFVSPLFDLENIAATAEARKLGR